MKKCLLLFVALSLGVGSHLLAQQEVRFGQYRVVPEQNVARTRGAAKNALAAIAPTQGKVNVLMQFREVPDAKLQRELARAGVVLEGYVGGNAYFAQVEAGSRPIDFARHGATSVIGVRPEWKVSRLLSPGRVPRWADRGNGRAAVTVSWFSNADASLVRGYFASRGFNVAVFSRELALAEVEMPLAEVMGVAAQPWVRRVRPVDPPQELNNYNGGVLSAGKYLSLPSELNGRGLTGKGVRVGLWDGNVEPHVDYGDRVHVLEFEVGLQQTGGHGMHTCGTIAGAGMLDPKARGIAPAAELYAMNFNVQSNGLIPQVEMLQVHEKYNIALTSNSYGMGLKNLCRFYDQLSYSAVGSAYATDLLSSWYPTMTHIYAAGNDQGECGRKYGTSTNRAKNVVHVGAVDAVGNMSDFSSWGPMDDGRLVPTVSAKGVATRSTVANNGYAEMQGTSMACPTVSGIVTLLTERYHQLHGGQHMNSALVRGILANTADDTGNAGPDYKFGYGIVNGEAAARVIEHGWYRNDTLVAGTAAQPFTINVPAGVKQLRVMLTWTDAVVDKEYPYGEPALINDLDLSVRVAGKEELPWILKSAEPRLAATRGRDTLNNIEQVTIDSPAAGDVEVLIAGHDKIREGQKQGYTLTWFFDYGLPLLLHPVGGELFSPGDDILLRADNMVGTTKAEISYDGGETYTYVGKVKRFYSINLRIPNDAPSTVNAKVRLTDEAGHVLVNARPFTIAGQPRNLKFTSSPCSFDDWKLAWDKVDGAKKYAVLKADVPNSKWEKLGETAGAEYPIAKEKIVVGGRNVYAVAVVMEDGSLGPRSMGLVAAQPTPITLTAQDLPYLESFVTLPPVGASFVVGENLAMTPVETPASIGFPVGSRMIVVQVSEEASVGKKLFEDPKNVFAIKICKLDLRGVEKGKKIVFNAIALMQQTTDALGAQMRLKVNGKQAPVTTGGESAIGNGKVQQLYWDLSEYAGDENVQLELEYACHEQRKGLILVGYGLSEASEAPNVGLLVQRDAIGPKPKMEKEKLQVSLYSSSAKMVPSVPIVVRLDGKVAMSHVEKELKPYEQRDIEIPVDFHSTAPEGHIFKVKVSATEEGDENPRNDTASCEVYNMGDIYPHPISTMSSFLGMTFPSDPKAKVEVDGPVVYTDMGGLMRGYANSQLASVRFVPKDPKKVIQATFVEWSLGEGDSLSVYASKLRRPFVYEGEGVSYVLKGESAGRHEIALSRAKDGGLYMYFTAGERSHGGRGWKAIVQAVPRVNYLTLQPLEVADRYASGEAGIKIKVQNNTPVALRRVNGEVVVEGEKHPIAFEIPVVEANAEMNAVTGYEIPTKVRVPDPSLLTVTVKVYGNDVDMTDNVQRVTIRNDKFWYGGSVKKPTSQGILQAKVVPNKVDFLGVTNEKALTYHIEKELLFYTETINPLQVKLQKEVTKDQLPATLHVWIDLDESDGALRHEAPEYYSVPLKEKETEYTINVDLKEQQAGKRRMRIAVLPGEASGVKDFIEKKEVAWGRALDITADIQAGKNPRASDLGLKFFTPIASGRNLSREQELKVNIVNYGHTAVSNFKIKVLVNGEQQAEETVTETVQPFGRDLLYTLKHKVDLSASSKAYNIELQLEDDGALENNTVRQLVVSLPAPARDRLYALDFKRVKGEAIDYSSMKALARLGKNATVEGWFYPRRAQIATLFDGSGVFVVSTYQMNGGIPDNAIAIICGKNQMNVTGADALMPGQFHHVAISFSEKSSGWDRTYTAVEVYIDGKPVKTVTQGGDGFSFAGLLQAGRFDGQVKMLRVWNKVLSLTEIEKNMRLSVRGTDGKLPAGCVAEFMMNEGTFGFIGSGNDAAELLTKRVGHKDSSIWVDLGKQLVTGVKFEGQLLKSKWESEGLLTFVMPHDYQASKKLKGEVFTPWSGTKLMYGGAEVNKDTEFDFNTADKTIALKASIELFGQKLEQEVKVRLVVDKSPEAEIAKISLLVADNPNLKQDVVVASPGQTIRLANVEGAAPDRLFDIGQCKITIDALSDGASVAYKDQKASKGEKLAVDLSRPVVLEVTAENTRDKRFYTVEIVKGQSVEWDKTDLHYTFTAETMAMGAMSSSGLPVVYLSDDAHVVTVDGAGKLHTSGVGETTLTAFAPASGIYAASERVARKVKVSPATLTVSPKATELEEGEAVPEVELEYTGRLFNENPVMFKPVRYAIYRDAATRWDPTMGTLPVGLYDVKPVEYTGPYVDGNYTVTLANGKLEVKPSTKNRRVAFAVVGHNGGAALAGARVAIAGSVLTTDIEGKATIALAPGNTYPYTVSLSEYAESKGEVELRAEDIEVRIELKKLEVTVTYVAAANGAVAGKLSQRLAKGADAEEVVAIPDEGYAFEKWSDGSKEAVRQDKSVSADATYTASFDVIKFDMKYLVSEGGEIATGAARQRVEAGRKGEKVVVKAQAGYHFAGWSDGVATLEREDVAVRNLEVKALFYKAFALPLCEDYEEVDGLPFAWESRSESSKAKFAVWKFGTRTELPAGTRQCATINSDDADWSGEAKAGLHTPWIDISKLNGSGLQVTYTLHIDNVYGKKSLKLQYRTEESGAWQDLQSFDKPLTPPKSQVAKIDGSVLKGKQEVQFRWFFEAVMSGGAAVDNVVIGASDKAVILYVAGEHGKVAKNTADPNDAAKEVKVETVAGTPGEVVTAVPDEGYLFDKWSDGKKDLARQDSKSGRYKALFKAKPASLYTLVYAASEEGCIKGAAYQPEVEQGSDGAPVTAEATKEGYYFAKWSDGSSENPRIDKAVKADVNVKAEFAVKVYTLTYTAGANGTLEGKSPQAVEYGKDGEEVKAVPAAGYRFVEWSDGSTDNPRIDRAVKAEVNVTAEFAVNVYTLSYTAGANGTIEGKSPQAVEYGKDGEEVKAVPAAGYRFVKWSDGRAENPRKDRAVKEDVNVEAEFAAVATLTFVVKDDAGSAVAGAEVLVEGKRQTTNGAGKAAFAELELKEYSFTVSKAGFKPAEGKKMLEAGGTTVEVTLEKVANAVESVLLSMVTLRPNPASTKLYVGNAAAVEYLKVITLHGETLLQLRNEEGASEAVVPLAGIVSGMYLLQIEGDGAQRAIPFVVTK